MKKLFLVLISLFFLFSCSSYTCLNKVLDEASKIQNKDNLIFVEGAVWPDTPHVQLWLYNDNTFKILSGHLFEDKWKFQATDFYTYDTYMFHIKNYYLQDE